MQAEQLFFSALEECLASTCVLRKGRDVQGSFDRHGARLLSDHTAMGFEHPERGALDEIYHLLLGALMQDVLLI